MLVSNGRLNNAMLKSSTRKSVMFLTASPCGSVAPRMNAVRFWFVSFVDTSVLLRSTWLILGAVTTSWIVTLLLSTVVPSVFGSLSLGVTATLHFSPISVSWLTIVVKWRPASVSLYNCWICSEVRERLSTSTSSIRPLNSSSGALPVLRIPPIHISESVTCGASLPVPPLHADND